MRGDQLCYLAHMLRLWQVECDGAQTWRASLESANTGERCGLANLDALIAFLREQTSGEVREQDQDGPAVE